MSTVAVVKAASKAAPKVKEGANKVNKDTKGALSWVVVGGVAVLTVLVLKTISNASKVGNVVGSAADVASTTLDQLVKELKDPNLNSSDSPIGNAGTIPVTITDLEAQNRANVLLEAMDGFGTDFERVKMALSNITVADYGMIAIKFGTPRYDGAGEGMWPASKRNLSYWIAAELDNNELQQIRMVLPGIF
ncbi:hypothetical protein [Algibacter sp. PT7-4]|uniref:hypothetical protein n=1 Tax=Algibacter ulvanivorans TaxID=3400999 RepID=UPI003AB04C7C